ncbi:hypothetical protein FIBSPDRAFT_751529 [Athelia psychrophila]|uniref:SWR1-complex protein 5 n=1 Tax=Athelia psychrophila TaxID=1759441 RepID=A0A166DFJ2_9AGAM|nr:hypothetical protein FIBSPDRAFT_751529 [Fibularhizoctonia sp. CBS 109695]
MSSFLQQPLHDSEDEDEDYVPTAENTDSDDDIKPQHDKAGVEPEEVVEDEEAKKKAREALWADFQASVSTPPPVKPDEAPKTLKIEKRYLFAGKEVVEVVEVAADSADAKIWPLWRPSEILDSSLTSQLSPPTSLAGPSIVTADTTQPPETRPPVGRRPGPRKSKTTLSAPPPKAKKLSTLDKSAMDWNKHINTHSELEARDELEANRRGGGYLEKVDFLKRVDERKEDVIEANKPTKRRKL